MDIKSILEWKGDSRDTVKQNVLFLVKLSTLVNVECEYEWMFAMNMLITRIKKSSVPRDVEHSGDMWQYDDCVLLAQCV